MRSLQGIGALFALILLQATFINAGLASSRPSSEGTCTIVMTPHSFWALIGPTTDDNEVVQYKALEAALAQRTPTEIIGFDLAMQREVNRSFTWDLWGAAYIANGGASDDGFHAFQLWLISRGRDAFETVLGDPDALADIVPLNKETQLDMEILSSAAPNAWAGKTGRTWNDYLIEHEKQRDCVPIPSSPAGVKSKDLKTRYPKLWRRFGNNPLG